MDQPSRIDPGYFLRSFLVLIVHYVVLFIALLLGMLLIAWIGYPDIYELWNLPRDARQPFHDVWENNPQQLFPAGMCWSLVGAGLLLGLLTGLSVAFWAPFSGAGHGVFLAIVCIVTFLQVSITQSQVPKALMMGLLVAAPCGIVLGSRWGERILTKPEPDEAADSESISENPAG